MRGKKVLNVLLVGAGAVGQVYGYYLAKADADVSFLVKEKHAAECRRGFLLYYLNNRAKRRDPIRFSASGIFTKPEELTQKKWDQVYLCFSSTALQSYLAGEDFKRLRAAIGNATLVLLQPGPEDREAVLKQFPADQLISGMISIVSYHAPLEGESFPETGVAYWIPPLSPSPLSGPKMRLKEVVDALNQGGLPAKAHPDVAKLSAFPAALLMPFLVALENAGWSFNQLKASDALTLVSRATSEAMAILSKRLGTHPPRLLGLFGKKIGKTAYKSILSLAPHFTPFPLETYLKAHFTKVGDQTRLIMRTYVELGKKEDLSTQALETLMTQIDANRVVAGAMPRARV